MKVALLLLMAGAAFSQNHLHRADTDSAPRALDLPPPVKIEGIGHSHLDITTNSSQAQIWFDQGLSLLHCFWDFEALRAFEEAARLDPDCAMCQWGIYQALNMRGGREKDAKAALKRMGELAPKAADHEQRYIRADTAGNEKKDDEKEQVYTREMEALIYHYPDDLDARLFLALSLGHGFDENGDPRSGTLYGQALLRDLMRRYPENAAAHHYWIHAAESSSHPELALESAGKLAKLAPGSGHMVHMPGHIFFRTGDYERARQSFLDSMRVDEQYMAAQKIEPRDDWNYAHDISYLIANSAEEGRRHEALELAAKLKPLAYDPMSLGNPNFYVLQIGGTPARLEIRFGNWQEVIDHPLDFGVADGKLPAYALAYRDGLVVYARGMQALDQEKVEGAALEAEKLEALLWRLSREAEKKPAGSETPDRAKFATESVVKLLGVASKELNGNLESHRNRFEKARELLLQAADDEKKLGYAEPPRYSRPAEESLGFACIRAGRWDEAREAFRKVLVERPNTGFAWYGIALTWQKQGNREEARNAWREFLQNWPHADANLRQVMEGRAFLAGRAAETAAR